MNYLIDSHCHIDFPQFKNRSVDDILQKAKEHGVEKIVNIIHINQYIPMVISQYLIRCID